MCLDLPELKFPNEYHFPESIEPFIRIKQTRLECLLPSKQLLFAFRWYEPPAIYQVFRSSLILIACITYALLCSVPGDILHLSARMLIPYSRSL